MEYTEDQLSGKLPMSQKPWEDGLYEVTHKDGAVFYSYFINGDWLSGNAFAELASQQSPLVTKSTERDRESWRGLSFDPSAPKKRAGNKRKTAYLLNVSRINHGIAPRVVAVFSSAKVANSQLEKDLALMKNQDGATAWLTHIRFRTPEA